MTAPTAPIEEFDDAGEVGQRARQPTDLVDHHHIDQPLADVREQGFQTGRSYVMLLKSKNIT